MKYNRGTALWASIALLALALAQVARATTYYTYDNLGRVTQVIESDGTTTQYSYDANGNVTSINRIAGTTVLSIGSVSSSTGAAGSSVTITGSGFSSIPGQDVVTFNGVAATVTYASGNRLVVTVPAGAGTGDISITTPASSITSDSSFTVVPVSITSFSPVSGVVGTVLTVNGGGFDLTPSNNTVLINGIPATVSSATVTQLQVTVSSGATPGHVSVNAPLGSAVSAGDFFIPAPGYTTSQISGYAAVVSGEAHVFPINPPSTAAVVLFDGTVGQHINVVSTELGNYGDYTVFAPDGTVFTSNAGLYNNTSTMLPALTQTGTYAWYYSPAATPTAATIGVETDVLGDIPTDGTPAMTSLAPGQNATYTFNGTAGQTYTLTMMPLSGPGDVTPTIYNPDGSVLFACPYFDYPYNDTNFCNFTVGTTGTYTLRLLPNDVAAWSFGLYVVQDFSAVLTAGTPGPTAAVSLATGQRGFLNFTAAANQTFALYISGVSSNPSTDSPQVSVSGPTGFSPVQQGFGTNGAHGAYTFNLPNLPAGNYLVTMWPYYNEATISAQATLANGVTGTLAANGAVSQVPTTYVPGQNAYLSFNGTQGQELTLVLSQLSLQPTSIDSVDISVNKPDGSAYTSGTCYPTSIPACPISLGTLPETGTYSVVVEPNGLATIGFALALATDTTGSLTLNNPAPVVLSSTGQQGMFTFVATADEPVTLSVSSLTTMPPNTSVSFILYHSNGSLVTWTNMTASGTYNFGDLPPGSYIVVVAPNNGATGSMSIDLQPASSVSLALNGALHGIGTTASSQSASATFNATAGESVGVAVSSLQFAPSAVSAATVTIYNPDGSQGLQSTCAAGVGCALDYRNVPTTGTYTVTITPNGSASMLLDIAGTLNLTGTLTPGAPYSLALSEIGQNAMLSFTAGAAQSFVLQLSNLTSSPAATPVAVQVYNSSGYAQAASTTLTTDGALNISNLVAGTYVGWIGPQTPATLNTQVTLTAVGTTAVPANGSSNAVSSNTPGQGAFVTFSATSGQSIGVSLTNLSLTPTSPGNVNWSISAPDGSTVVRSSVCALSSSGCSLGIMAIPLSGTYTITVVPEGQQTMSFSIAVTQSVTGNLAPGTSEALSLSQLGQSALLAFTVTAGESLIASVTCLESTPAGTAYQVGVYTRGGISVTGVAMTSGGVLRLTGLVPGNYYLWVVPQTPATSTMQLSFQQDANAVLPTNGSSTNVVTTVAGENAYPTFQAAAGQSIGVTLANLSLSPASPSAANWSITAPDGSTALDSNSCTVGSITGCSGAIATIPITGTYIINIAPDGQQTLSVAVTVSQ